MGAKILVVLRFLARRIGRRIGAVVGAAMVVAGLGGVFLVFDQTARTQETVTKRQLTTLATTLAMSFRTFDARHGQHPIDDIAAELGAFPEIETLLVFDEHGRVRWSSDARRKGSLMPPDILSAFSSAEGDAPVQASSTEHTVEVLLPLRRTTSCLPCHQSNADPLGGVFIALENDELVGDVGAVARRAGLIAVASVAAITLLLLVLINRLVVVRLSRLARAMSAAEEGDYLVRAQVESHDEIGALTSTFNRMLAKITSLNVERIESEREMSEVKDELSLKAQLAEKSEQLVAANLRLESQVVHLSFLNRLSRHLSSKLDIDALLDDFCRLLNESLHVPEVAVLVLDRSKGQIQALKTFGFEETRRVRDMPFADSEGVTGEVAKRAEPIYVPDLKADARETAYRVGAPRGSLYSTPMIYKGEVIGVLNLSSSETHAFSEEQRTFFSSIASHAALALANARLFQETLELSITDGLTGLLNRRAMESRLELEWSRAMRDDSNLSLVIIDIDHFKVYNDQHGHQLGDESLRRVGRILERSVRKVDAVARYGGEEFVVILPRASKAEAVEVARKLRRTVEQSDFPRGYMQPLGRVTISCGVATAPDDATTVHDLIERADEALFAAKEAGRNKVRASPAVEPMSDELPIPDDAASG